MDENNRLFIWANFVVLAIIWALALGSYDSLPNRIPLHFGWDGQPDRWGDKSLVNFFLLPVISTVLTFLMIFLTRFPKLYNFPQKEKVNKWPEDKKKPVFAVLNRMMLTVAVVINLMFLMIQYMMIETAKNQKAAPLDYWPLWILVAVIFIMPICYLVKLSRLVKEIGKTVH